MTSLKEEEAFAVIVKTEFLDNTCSFCFDRGGIVHKCKGCHILSYCNDTCQKSDWANHKIECRVLKAAIAAGHAPGNPVRHVIRILLKSKEELAQKAFNGRTWDSLETRGGIPVDFVTGVDCILELLRPVKKVTRAEAGNALRKVLTHGIEIFDSNAGSESIGFGIYLGLCIHKHSCIPDSQLIFTGTKASLRAFDETAKYSPNLTISYTNRTPWTPDRKARYKIDFSMDCTCPLCADENHIMNRMGSSCHVSCCEDAAGILDENSSGPYKCNKCGKASTITVNKVKSAEDKIKTHLKMVVPGLSNNVDINQMAKKTIDLLLISETILSVYNYQYICLCFMTRGMSVDCGLHGMCGYILDKELKAVDYYLHEKDRRRAAFLMFRTHLKYILGKADDFDRSKAINTVDRTYGEDHPVAVRFKKQEREYDEFNAAEQAHISSLLRHAPLGEPLMKLFL